MRRLCGRFGILTLGVGLPLILSACSRQAQQEFGGQKVYGKVTCDGQPVPYGFVLLYSHEKGRDPHTGGFVPVAQGEIQNGKYEVPHVPPGMLIVCVATDPDIHPSTLLQPVTPTAPLAKGGGVGREAPAEPPGAKRARPNEQPKGDAPGIPGSAAVQGVGPPGMPPVKLPNPAAEKLTDEQKQTLRALHAKYGEFGRSPLAVRVQEGSDQPFDILLAK